MTTLEAQTPLLDGKIKACNSGGWRSAFFLLGAGILERFAYFGIESNLVNYLTGPLGQSVALAAANVNIWSGVVSLVPVPGSFLADSCFGRYTTIIITSLLYILGLGLMTLTAVLISFGNSKSLARAMNAAGSNAALDILFYVSVYLVALAQGFKPCVQAFGADQFDGKEPEEKGTKSSLFNWWGCGLAAGGVSAHLILHYIQDNVNWGIGFGIPCLAMFLGLTIILIGNRSYRFPRSGDDEERPGENGGQEATRIIDPQECSQNLKFVNCDLPAKDNRKERERQKPISCCSSKDEMGNKVLKLILIWFTCLTYTIAFAQASTLFTKQATTMDKSIGLSFNLPSASLRIFIPLTIVFFLTIYDRIFIPTARMITKKARGITMLQRMGTGMAISVFNMVIAALVEKKRLKTAQQYGLVDIPNATVPMSFWWLVPQYILYGISESFAMVGMQEFFYDQVPSELRSVGLSFNLGAIGIGSFLSSFLVSVIEKATSKNGENGWFSNNLNRAHIDYFYWLLAGIGAIGLASFIFLANSYAFVEEKVLDHDESFQEKLEYKILKQGSTS